MIECRGTGAADIHYGKECSAAEDDDDDDDVDAVGDSCAARRRTARVGGWCPPDQFLRMITHTMPGRAARLLKTEGRADKRGRRRREGGREGATLSPQLYCCSIYFTDYVTSGR